MGLRRTDLIEPELSYRIVGILFQVYNELGSGHLERVYQRAVRDALTRAGIAFQEQVAISVRFKERVIGRFLCDFLIESKVLLELKIGNRFTPRNIQQVTSYLKSLQFPLAILANFGRDGVIFKRILNLHS